MNVVQQIVVTPAHAPWVGHLRRPGAALLAALALGACSRGGEDVRQPQAAPAAATPAAPASVAVAPAA